MITPLNEKASLRRSAYWKIGAGMSLLLFNLLFITVVAANKPSSLHFFDNVLLILFLIVPIVLVWGSMDYMASKGYSKMCGLLVLLGVVGLLVMAMLPDHNRVMG